MYKYYFLNEKKLYFRICLFNLYDCYYIKGIVLIVKKECLFIFICIVFIGFWRKIVI